MPRIAFALLVLLICLQPISAQTETLSAMPTERSLARGQSHSFTIQLEAEQFLQVVVQQRGIDVVIRLYGPDGASLGEFDSPNGTEGPEPVSMVSVEAGVYRFEVVPLRQTEDIAPGRYEIRIIEQRKATEQELQSSKNSELLKARGMALLNEAAESLPTIRRPQTRIRAQLQIAQILASSDEKLAVKLASEAAEGVKEYIAGADEIEEDYYQTYELAMQLRQEVIQVLGQYDPDAALAFLRATRTLQPPGQSRQQWDRELYFELSLAGQLAAKDPNRAVQLAEESLKRGYSAGLIEVVGRLRATEPELAARLARLIASKLRDEKLLQNQEAGNVAIGLLRVARGQVRRFQAQRNTGTAAKPPVPLLTDEEYKALFDKTVAEAMAYNGSGNAYSPERNTAQNLLSSLKSMAPEMTGLQLPNAALLEKKSAELSSSGDPSSMLWDRYQQLINAGSIEEGMQTVAAAPATMRDQLYQQVAQKAANAGDLTRAKQIVKDNVANASQRQQALSQFEQQAIHFDAAKGKIEEALRATANLRTAKERAMIIGQIASQIGPGMKRAAALELLEQARSLIGNSPQVEGHEQLNALMEVSRAFSRYDSKRAFEMIEPLIDQLNEMAAAALVLNNFGQQYYQNGELLLENGNTLSSISSQLNQALGTLARSNFDRAKSAAERMQRPELRLNAYIAIAQQTVTGDTLNRNATFRRMTVLR